MVFFAFSEGANGENAFSLFLLGKLTRLVLGKENKDEFIAVLKLELDNIRGYVFPDIIEEIEQYLPEIEQAIRGEKPNYSLLRLSMANPYDPVSFLIPDLNIVRNF